MPRFRIRVEGITIRLRIGAYPGEGERERNIVINFEAEGDWGDAARADDLSKTVDYDLLSSKIRDELSGRSYKLMEALALDALKIILSMKGVKWARVEVIKARPAEGVGRSIISAEGTREELG